MSSDKKKSSSTLILLLLFIVISGGSWFFFNGKQADTESIQQELNAHVADNIDANETDDDSGAGHGDHNHGATENADGQIGVKGQIHKLSPPAIYGTRGIGDPNAPVKIQEFFSLTCNHCAAFHKETYQDIKKNLIDTGKVYFIYEEFPLNGPALYGSMIARCLPKERYSGFIDILLHEQDKWAFSGDFKAALLQHAKLAGMNEEEFDACFNNKDLQKAVATNIKEATDAWKINSTPSFVVNDGERILYGGQPYEKFEKLVAELTGETSENPTKTIPTEEDINQLITIDELVPSADDVEAEKKSLEKIKRKNLQQRALEEEVKDFIKEGTESSKDSFE